MDPMQAERHRIICAEVYNREYNKGDRVRIYDARGHGERPSGEKVGDGSLWVLGTVEFTVTTYGYQYRYVSVYCDDGRGRRVVPPHEVVPA